MYQLTQLLPLALCKLPVNTCLTIECQVDISGPIKTRDETKIPKDQMFSMTHNIQINTQNRYILPGKTGCWKHMTHSQ